MASFLSLYETTRLVRIHNNFLGHLYYSLVLLIIIGQLGVVLYNRDYLEYDTPTGIIRLSVKPYTHPDWDEYSSVLPHPLDSDYMFISTGVEEKIQRIQLNSTKKWETVSEEFHVIDLPEDIQIKIEHTMFSPKFFSAGNNERDSTDYVQSSRNLNGKLRDVNDTRTIKELPAGKADSISLKELFEASNINLDEKSGIFHHENETLRERGAVLHVSIIYSNIWNYTLWGENEIQYQYKIFRLPETGYKLTESVKPFDPDFKEESGYKYRYLLRRYGLHFQFVQEGELGRFSWSNLVLHVLSALGLLGLLTLVIDYIGIYFISGFMQAKYMIKDLHEKKD